jgi:cell migration-inducing and hyaluronan-binding protein
LLLSGSSLFGMGTTVYAQDNHAHMDMAPASPASAMKSVRWSDPSAWPNGKVPGANAAVTIEGDKDVLLDVAPAALRSLTIKGKLRFADTRDIELATDWIHVQGGTLQIGTKERPHTHKATITLTDKVKGEDISTMGDRGIMLMRGSLDLHGARQNSWTKLAATAEKGSRQITVLDAADWRAGDQIVLASTDFNPRQAEVRNVTAVKGNTLTLDRPLAYMHYGKVTYGVDERGEVGLLSRNIRIQASEDAAQSYFGGHIMAMVGSQMHVDGVELSRMGQHLTLARYPIHWHVNGDADGQYIRNASIHDTYNRCVTVHGTNNLRVENNVTYNTVGHCFFMEDGIEKGNEFLNNLAIQTKCHPTLDCVPQNLAANGELGYPAEQRAAVRKVSLTGALLPSDNTAASFWITNPDNVYRGNVAAGSDQAGFWLSVPEHPNGVFKGTEISAKTWPRRTPLREFRDNVAHSNFDGFMFDRNIEQDNTFAMAGTTYLPLSNPADVESKVVETHLENLTSYKNRNGGLWSRGALYVYRDLKFADNAIGFTQSGGDFGNQRFNSRVEHSLFVGESDNRGNPATPEEVRLGRSLPKPKIPDFPIRGYEYYDYRNEVADTKFVNFQDNAVRKTGALSWLLYTSAGVTTSSSIERASFVNAKPVYFPKIDPRFDNDNRGGLGYRTSSIHDLDGSVTGIRNSHILINDGENDSVATDKSCKIQPTWNAAVCTGDVGLLYFADTSNTISFGTRASRFERLAAILSPQARANRPAQAAPAAPEKPITLIRDGKEFKVTGSQSTVRAGAEIEVKTERPEVSLGMSEMDLGSWVIFKLPGFTKAASGTEQPSLDALRKAKETSYFKGGDALWVKMVVSEPPVMPIHPARIQAFNKISRSAATVATRQ